MSRLIRSLWNLVWNIRGLIFRNRIQLTSRSIPESVVGVIWRDIASKLELKSTDTVLDLGCGSGLFTERMADTGRRVFAVERSKTLFLKTKG